MPAKCMVSLPEFVCERLSCVNRAVAWSQPAASGLEWSYSYSREDPVAGSMTALAQEGKWL
jgi:hypothetical protein